MCPDHVAAYAHDMGWHIKDRRVRVERLDVTKLRSDCPKCLISLTVEWTPDIPLTGNPGIMSYCPRCGCKVPLFAPDPHKDWLDWVCEQFNGMPRQLIELLYQEWPRNKYPTFMQYVNAQAEAFMATGEMLND